MPPVSPGGGQIEQRQHAGGRHRVGEQGKLGRQCHSEQLHHHADDAEPPHLRSGREHHPHTEPHSHGDSGDH